MSARPAPCQILTAAALCAIVLVGSTPVAAQSTRRPSPKIPKWTIEGFGAFSGGVARPEGEQPELPAGTPFATEGGFQSRSNPSWFYGDGARLFNEVAAQFRSRFGVQIPAIVPLDGTALGAGRESKPGPGFGGRLTRRLTPRFSMELAVQRSQGRMELTGDARNGIEATRASFEEGFKTLLGTIPQAGLQVTSAAEIPGDASVSQTMVSVALNVGLTRSRGFATHATLGVGRATNSTEPLNVRLRGSYQFRTFDIHPVNESDVVTIRFEDRESAVLGIFGAGFTYDLGARHGLRMDARVHAGTSGQTTTVSASSTTARTGPPLALPSVTNPSVQFSNSTAFPSSLAGSASNLRTFTADGVEIRPAISASFYLRF